MLLTLNGKQVEVELDRNHDGSRYIAAGYFTDGDMVDLTDDELDLLDSQSQDEINGMWG